MAEKMHLTNAPIKEFLIDIQTRGSRDMDQPRPVVPDQLSADYPHLEFLRPPGAADDHHGIRAFSRDRLQAVQFRPDGFTFSRLAPYSNWPVLRAEAARLWSIYAEWAKPQAVRRLAVRSINEISIALPMSDFGDYLSCPPEIPAGLPQALSSFLMRIVLPHPANGATAVLTQALESPSPTHAPIVLDIDVFKDVELTCACDACWPQLDALREFQNEIFFRSLTDKTRAMYQ